MKTEPNDSIIDIEQVNNILVAKGLSKREYFAACALQGYDMTEYTTISEEKSIAIQCVSMADALISELNKRVK